MTLQHVVYRAKLQAVLGAVDADTRRIAQGQTSRTTWSYRFNPHTAYKAWFDYDGFHFGLHPIRSCAFG
jgi:hypothetical protein